MSPVRRSELEARLGRLRDRLERTERQLLRDAPVMALMNVRRSKWELERLATLVKRLERRLA